MLYEVVPKAAVYLSALVAVGVPVARALLKRSTGAVAADEAGSLEARLRRVALLVGIIALLALALRAWAHTAAVFGAADAFRWENLHVIAIDSRWGAAWQWQAIAGAGLFLAGLALSWRQTGWMVYAVAAVLFTLTLPLLGHAAGAGWRMAVHATHLVAGGVWIGTLGAIASIGVLRGAGQRRDDRGVVKAIVERFSSVALPGATTVAMSGLVLAALYVAAPLNLIATSYGQALLVKLAAVAGIVACGRLNWQRARRGADPSSRTIVAELGFAGAAVAATSVLSELAHP